MAHMGEEEDISNDFLVVLYLALFIYTFAIHLIIRFTTMLYLLFTLGSSLTLTLLRWTFAFPS